MRWRQPLCPRGSLLGGSRGGRATRSRRPHTPTGALVPLSLDYLTSLYYIPKSALAAVIIMAVVPCLTPRS